MIYIDKTTGSYLYKNVFAHHTIDFDSTEIFTLPALKFNLFKQILNTFNGIDDFNNMRISKVVINSNMFMRIESNLSLVTSTIYKPHID
jgi:hypothetical protein